MRSVEVDERVAHPDRVVDDEPVPCVERADAVVGRFGLEKDASQTAGPGVGQ